MRNVSAFQPKGATGLNRGLVAYWRLDDVNDSLASNTLTNLNTTTFVSGLLGNGANFVAASSQALRATSTSLLSNYSAMSINLWFKADVINAFQGLLWKSNDTTYSIGLRMTDTNKLYGVVAPSSGETAITGGTTLTTGTWYMATLTYDGSNINLYLNAASDATQVALSGATKTSTDNMYIGAQVLNTYYDGIIDEVGVWNRALTSTEITELYNSGTGIQLPSQSLSTKAYYPLNGNSAGSLYDSLSAYWKLESTADSVGSYTLTNNGTTTFTPAKINNGASLNGSSQSLNNNSIWGATSYPRSYGGWFSFDTLASDQAMITIGDGSVHYYSLRLRDSDNMIVFRANNTTQAADVDTGIVATASTWYHCIVVQNSATDVTLYINGVATNTNATTFSATVSQFYIGYLGRGGVWYMDGLADEIVFYNRALTSYEVTRLYNLGNGMTIDNSAVDFSGNGNHGTETAITYPQGRFGQGAKFNGSTSKVALTGTTLPVSGDFTMSVWYNGTTPTGDGLVGYGSALATGQRRSILIVSGNAYFGGYSADLDSNTKVVDGRWHNIIVTYTGTTCSIYVDGVRRNTGTLTLNTTNQVFRIGCRADDTSFISATADEVIIESRAWTAKEVETYYRKSTLNYRKGFWANIVALVLSAQTGVFTLTGKATTYTTTMSAGKGVFSILGKLANLILTGTTWTNQTKNSSTWTSQTKNTSTFTNQTKNSSTWTNRNKS